MIRHGPPRSVGLECAWTEEDSLDAGDRRERKRKTRWRLIALWGLVALLLIGVATGGGFYLWFRAQVGAANSRVGQDVIQALRETTSTSTPTSARGAGIASTTTIKRPSGMNIVLLGSDTRASTGAGGRSDTIIIVHVDATKNFLSMLSIPRDLRVKVPGHGLNKINTAYRFGGPALVIRTIEASFGIDLDHYVEVDFTRSSRSPIRWAASTWTSTGRTTTA